MADFIEVDGKQFAVDEEGYLANLTEWVPGVAGVMAKHRTAAGFETPSWGDRRDGTGPVPGLTRTGRQDRS
jgi:hypothetical protein